MGIVSEIKLSTLEGAFRLDAEFWRPEYLRIEGGIRKLRHETLGNLSISLRKGVFSILADSYVEQGVPFYRSSNVGAIVPAATDLVHITEQRHSQEHKTALARGDIMLAKTGKEAASVVLASECNVSQDVICIRPDRNLINPFYLAVFLNTEPGVLQLRRWFQGQVQMHLSLPDARQILVPIFQSNYQIEIEALVLSSEKKEKAAQDATEAAGALLITALGFDAFERTSELSYERRFSQLRSESRFDAEFFNPKYQSILARLRESGMVISDVAALSEETFDPAMRSSSPTFRYIEIGALDQHGHAEPASVLTAEAPSRATWVVKAGDIVTSTVRPIRRLSAMIGEDQGGSVCSSGFAVLTPRPGSSGLEPEVLLTYLRLPIVCEILDLYATASMYPSIPVRKLMQIPIIVPDRKTRDQIVRMVRKGITLRRESNELLEQAKMSVELKIKGALAGKGR